jgi:hypothetical protein
MCKLLALLALAHYAFSQQQLNRFSAYTRNQQGTNGCIPNPTHQGLQTLLMPPVAPTSAKKGD